MKPFAHMAHLFSLWSRERAHVTQHVPMATAAPCISCRAPLDFALPASDYVALPCGHGMCRPCEDALRVVGAEHAACSASHAPADVPDGDLQRAAEAAMAEVEACMAACEMVQVAWPQSVSAMRDIVKREQVAMDELDVTAAQLRAATAAGGQAALVAGSGAALRRALAACDARKTVCFCLRQLASAPACPDELTAGGGGGGRFTEARQRQALQDVLGALVGPPPFAVPRHLQAGECDPSAGAARLLLCALHRQVPSVWMVAVPAFGSADLAAAACEYVAPRLTRSADAADWLAAAWLLLWAHRNKPGCDALLAAVCAMPAAHPSWRGRLTFRAKPPLQFTTPADVAVRLVLGVCWTPPSAEAAAAVGRFAADAGWLAASTHVVVTAAARWPHQCGVCVPLALRLRRTWDACDEENPPDLLQSWMQRPFAALGEASQGLPAQLAVAELLCAYALMVRRVFGSDRRFNTMNAMFPYYGCRKSEVPLHNAAAAALVAAMLTASRAAPSEPGFRDAVEGVVRAFFKWHLFECRHDHVVLQAAASALARALQNTGQPWAAVLSLRLTCAAELRLMGWVISPFPLLTAAQVVENVVGEGAASGELLKVLANLEGCMFHSYRKRDLELWGRRGDPAGSMHAVGRLLHLAAAGDTSKLHKGEWSTLARAVRPFCHGVTAETPAEVLTASGAGLLLLAARGMKDNDPVLTATLFGAVVAVHGSSPLCAAADVSRDVHAAYRHAMNARGQAGPHADLLRRFCVSTGRIAWWARLLCCQ